MEVTSTIQVSVGTVSLALTRTDASSLLYLLARELGVQVWPNWSPSQSPSSPHSPGIPMWLWDPASAPVYKAGDWPLNPPVTVAINTDGPCSISAPGPSQP